MNSSQIGVRGRRLEAPKTAEFPGQLIRSAMLNRGSSTPKWNLCGDKVPAGIDPQIESCFSGPEACVPGHGVSSPCARRV